MHRPHLFPVNDDRRTHQKQRPAVKRANKEHRREHEKMSPIVNPAIHAAAVFLSERLERAEYQNADVITDEIEASNKQ